VPVDEHASHDEDHKAKQDLQSAEHHHPDGCLLDVLLLHTAGSCSWRSILGGWDSGVGHC
jgi:hypothetical protein